MDEHPPRALDYSRLYEYRFKDVDQRSRQLVWNEIAQFLWNRMGRPQRVLDPAGGRGEFVNAVPADKMSARRNVQVGRRAAPPCACISLTAFLSKDTKTSAPSQFPS